MKSFAYVIIDSSLGPDGSPRDKLYVGKSNDPYQRFENHIRAALSGQDTVFYRAIRSHGHENFVIRDTYECESEKEAFEKEKQLINEFRTYVGFENSRGYNSTLGGDGFDSETSSKNMTSVWIRDKDVRIAANKRRWESQEEKDKHSIRLKQVLGDSNLRDKRTSRMKERWNDPEYRAHMSERHAERWSDPEFRQAVISKIKAVKSTPEQKSRLAKRNTEKWKLMSDEERQAKLKKLQLARQEKNRLKKKEKEKKETPESKRQMGPTPDRARQTWQDSDLRARRIQAMKDAWKDPEKRQKRIQSMKRKTNNTSEMLDATIQENAPYKMREPLLADIVHQADIIATKEEKDT